MHHLTKDNTVFIDGASVWYQFDDSFRLDIGQIKVPFGMEETTSSSKLKAIERSAVNRQFAESLSSTLDTLVFLQKVVLMVDFHTT